MTFEKQDGSQKSISLLDIAEVYAINKAYEYEAQRLNLDAYFITLILPSEFHPSPRRCNGWKNEDWTADTGPDRAGAELQKMWRNIMRDIKKIPEFLGTFGMKVLEPHKKSGLNGQDDTLIYFSSEIILSGVFCDIFIPSKNNHSHLETKYILNRTHWPFRSPLSFSPSL